MFTCLIIELNVAPVKRFYLKEKKKIREMKPTIEDIEIAGMKRFSEYSNLK